MSDELKYESIFEAEEARNKLITANQEIDYSIGQDKLPDGEPKGTPKWEEWRSRAVRRKLTNQDMIRRINSWIKQKNRKTNQFDTMAEELISNAKAAFYALINHYAEMGRELAELKGERK